MRTVSVEPPAPGDPPDLDGRVVEGIESLAQRLRQAILWRVGEWFLARQRGLDYGLLIGHQVNPAITASAITEAIRIEGADEVTDVVNVVFTLDVPARALAYSAAVHNVYGSPIDVSETFRS